MTKLLEPLLSVQFTADFMITDNPRALRKALSSSGVVRSIRDGLEQGAVTVEEIRAFVSSITPQLCRGVRFPHEAALAGVAVALEPLAMPFAEEFIRDLAGLRLRELSEATAVARECLLTRRRLQPATTEKNVVVHRATLPVVTSWVELKRDETVMRRNKIEDISVAVP